MGRQGRGGELRGDQAVGEVASRLCLLLLYIVRIPMPTAAMACRPWGEAPALCRGPGRTTRGGPSSPARPRRRRARARRAPQSARAERGRRAGRTAAGAGAPGPGAGAAGPGAGGGGPWSRGGQGVGSSGRHAENLGGKELLGALRSSMGAKPSVMDKWLAEDPKKCNGAALDSGAIGVDDLTYLELGFHGYLEKWCGYPIVNSWS